MTEDEQKRFEKTFRKATMVKLSAVHHAYFDKEYGCYLSKDGDHIRLGATNGALLMWQHLQPLLDEQAERISKLEIQIGELRKDANDYFEIVQGDTEKLNTLASSNGELQKRLDAISKLLPSIKAENDLWGCEQVEHQIELLEQALNGEKYE